MLTLAVSFCLEKCRREQTMTSKELDDVWHIIRGCILTPQTRQLFKASRSAQGFWSVPLCSLKKDGNIDQLFRLHVWLPDGKRGNPDFAIHAHQCWAQSWILAGQGSDSAYNVEPSTGPAAATHAEYALVWSDPKGTNVGREYKTHQKFSRIENTKRFVRTAAGASSVHTNGMTYTIPAAAYHTTTVAPDVLHATLFLFDSNRGFKVDAGVLGPKYGDSSTQERDADTVAPTELAKKVEALRDWERVIRRGRRYTNESDMDNAWCAFDEALKIIETQEYFPNAPHYTHQTQGDRAKIHCHFGKYEQAEEILKLTIKDMPEGLERLELECQLSVIYNTMDRLDDSKRLCESQYESARKLNADRIICRTVGALGQVNYLLYLKRGHKHYLHDAIAQLRERIEIADQLRERASQEPDPVIRESKVNDSLTQASIGLSRLSLCHEANDNTTLAVETSFRSLELALSTGISTVIAWSRYFYGRALMRASRNSEALRQFNPAKTCTPAMVLCMERSALNRQYLEQLIKDGADVELLDENGYSALDYAVYNGDENMQSLLIKALRQKFKSDQFGQLKLILLQAQSCKDKLSQTMSSSRKTYAKALAVDGRTKLSDALRLVRYSEFVAMKRLPSSRDADKIRSYNSDQRVHMEQITMTPSPDDPNEHRQDKQMVKAVDELLMWHPAADRDSDHACIDQESLAPGCHDIVSLVDEAYLITLVPGVFESSVRDWCKYDAAKSTWLDRQESPVVLGISD
ncbi:hypothetical protein F5Y15DRAFT_408799 [Xylariaceae sp. FL0016]|nr:hypothetical protein F5Y15DRAFT_408799 [Xylariaceae sp. FL0016]